MSSSSTPSADAAPPSPMPPSVRVAVIVLSTLAGLLLLNAGLTWFGREQVADALTEGGQISRSDAERLVLLWMIPYVLLGLVLAASAWFLPRRHPWARWVGLSATVVLGLLTLFSILVSGGLTFGSLLMLVLSVAGATSLLARTTSTWIPRLRDDRPDPA